MLACKRCGKENQDHYKFCLGCGAELTAPPKDEGNVAMMKTMMADVGQVAAATPPRSPTPPGGVAGGEPSSPLPGMPAPSGGAPAPGGPPPAAPGAPPPSFGPPPGAPPPSAQRSAEPPPGAPPPSALGGPPPAGPPPAGPPPGVPAGSGGPPPASGQIGGPPSPGTGPLGGAGAAPSSGPKLCPNCHAEIPTAFKFCGACGTPVPDTDSGPAPRSTADFAAQPAKAEALHAIMTLIRPDGSEGGTHTLSEGENILGREHGAIFENDGYLSPTHCELIVNAAGAVVRDLDSLNGVFVRMTEEEEILPEQIIRIGQELLRFDTIEPPEPLEDGTEVMGSPNPGYWGKITVIIGFEVDGSAYPLFGDSVTLGRERGDINFPDDGYVSGLHARLFTRDGKVFLNDLGSSNGTFIKVQGERELSDGSFLLLGQQLFRLEIR